MAEILVVFGIMWACIVHLIRTDVLFSNDTQTPLGRLRLAGTIKNSAGVRGPTMRMLGSDALVYVLDGNGTYRDACDRVYRVHAGDLLVLFPDIGHLYGPGENAHWNEWHCVFDGAVFDLWQRTGLLNPVRPVLDLEPIPAWYNRFDAVLRPQHIRLSTARCILDAFW
jgi:hypothetical protein